MGEAVGEDFLSRKKVLNVKEREIPATRKYHPEFG